MLTHLPGLRQHLDEGVNLSSRREAPLDDNVLGGGADLDVSDQDTYSGINGNSSDLEVSDLQIAQRDIFCPVAVYSVVRGESQHSIFNNHVGGWGEQAEVKGPDLRHERSTSQLEVSVEPLSQVEGRRHLDLEPLHVNVDSVCLDNHRSEKS